MNDVDIRTLLNSAVDAELGGHRAAPPWNRAAMLDRPAPARRTAAWTVPVLAASVTALLAAGSIVAIDHSRTNRPSQVGNSVAPAPSVSVSESVSTDLERANRAYSEAVATAREATDVAGVSVEPLSAKDAARYKDSGVIGEDAEIMAPEPGKPYSFTMSYLAGPSDEPPAVLTTEVHDVASGTCPQPILARPGHAYRIRCQVMLLAGATGKATLTVRSPGGVSSGSMNLTHPDKSSTSPSIGAAAAARAYAEAVAAASEANKVVGVSDQPASGGRGEPGEGVGVVDGPTGVPDPGRSYSVTFLYVSGSDASSPSVLALSIADVAASRCPGAFRTRPNHSYHIRCQVTFRAGVVGKAYYKLIGPHGSGTTGLTIDPA